MRRAIIEVSPPLLAQIMKDGTGMVEVVANPLPADARIVDARLSFGGVTLQLVVESESFPEVPVGSHLPPLPSPAFRRQEEISSKSEFYSKLISGSPSPAEIRRLEKEHG